MKKIKVIHFIPGLTMGGAETLVKDYALGLNKSKFDVSVLCSIKNGTPYESLLEENNIRCIYLNDYSKRKPNFVDKIFIHFVRYLKVRKFLRNEKPDILHVHLGLCKLVKFSRVLCTVFYTVHNTPNFVWSGVPSEEKAVRWLVKNRNMRFITLHEQMKTEVDKRFNVNNSLVLNNGIDFKRFDIFINKSELKKRLGIPEKAFVIGHIGRFRKEKNHEFLVDIFSEISIKNSDSFLLMVGDGELKSQIVQKLDSLGLKENYLILSNRTDVPELMKIMDVFVFPSLFEGLGIVLIEAQKSGIKCIASKNVPSAAKVSNLLDFKSLSDSATSWAEKILSFNISKVEYFGIEKWDMKNVIKKLESFYEDAVK